MHTLHAWKLSATSYLMLIGRGVFGPWACSLCISERPLCSCQISTFSLSRFQGKEEWANLLALKSKTLSPPATKLGQGNIFRSVCQEFCPRGGRGCLPHCMLGYTPPRTKSRHPLPRDQRQTPPRHSACWEIRATSGRYASYWNAYLLCNIYVLLSLEWDGVCVELRANSDKSLNSNPVVSRLFLLANSCTCTM